jgi:UDP-N-acetylglucosamine 4,6-dehydratase/UDP-glucose 4-epimerase
MFEGKKILITGGTGSLGQALTKRLLKTKVDTVRIFSRNESKQVAMESKLQDSRLRFLIGDIRDYPRLTRAFEDIDIVFHAAALKHVPVIEYNPFEAIRTNVMGSQNVIDACLHENVEVVVGIGTDKAVSPLNTYGATKLLMEKLFVTANNYLNREKHKTKFIALRYGNVLGSSGSVVPKFIQQIRANKKITVTDPIMTRYSITIDEALDFILESTRIGKGSEIFVPKLRAYSIADLKQALVELMKDTGEEIIGMRKGEKMHEVLINEDEMRYTWELDNKYIIFDPLHPEENIKREHKKIRKTNSTTAYSSDTAKKITKKELKQIILKSGLLNSNEMDVD